QLLLLLAHGDHQATAGCELSDQRRRYLGWCRGHHDRIEWRSLRPAARAVAVTDVHATVAEAPQDGLGAARERLDDLDRVDLRAESGEDRRLVAGAGSDLQHAIAGLHR